jgi:hypothetical protein
MILSFVIFITFIVFIYVVVNPAVNTGEDKRAILQYIDARVSENVSAMLMSTSVDFNNSVNPSENCIVLKNFLFYTNITAPNILVKSETGSLQEAYEELFDLKIDRESASNRFFKIYQSLEFNRLESNLTISCHLVTETEYKIGSIQTGRYIFEKELNRLIENYRNNYEELAAALKVPPGNEFGLGFTQSNGTKVEVGEAPASANVYAEELPVQYVDNQTNIQSGFINIRVW